MLANTVMMWLNQKISMFSLFHQEIIEIHLLLLIPYDIDQKENHHLWT